MAGVPETVPCPCGNGYADHRRETVSNPNGRFRRKTVHHYRHSGCDLGGHIVTRNGKTLGRGGPVFDAERFDVGAFERSSAKTIATDGGIPR